MESGQKHQERQPLVHEIIEIADFSQTDKRPSGKKRLQNQDEKKKKPEKA